MASEELRRSQRHRRSELDMRRCGASEHEGWRNGTLLPHMMRLLGPYDPKKPYAEIASLLEMEKLEPLAQLAHQEGWESIDQSNS